ncbi:hypothetical protein D9M68_175110 [compost metagenome]
MVLVFGKQLAVAVFGRREPAEAIVAVVGSVALRVDYGRYPHKRPVGIAGHLSSRGCCGNTQVVECREQGSLGGIVKGHGIRGILHGRNQPCRHGGIGHVVNLGHGLALVVAPDIRNLHAVLLLYFQRMAVFVVAIVAYLCFQHIRSLGSLHGLRQPRGVSGKGVGIADLGARDQHGVSVAVNLLDLGNPVLRIRRIARMVKEIGLELLSGIQDGRLGSKPFVQLVVGVGLRGLYFGLRSTVIKKALGSLAGEACPAVGFMNGLEIDIIHRCTAEVFAEVSFRKYFACLKFVEV